MALLVISSGGREVSRVNVTSAADIEAALKLGRHLKFYDVLRLDRAVTIDRDNVTLDFTEAQVTSSASGGADSASNCMFRVVGTSDTATLNTTITADVVPGSSTLPVASTGSVKPGQLIEVGCTSSDAGDGEGESGPVLPRSELLKVADVSSGTLSLSGNTRLWHDSASSGQYVRATAPIRRFTVIGGEFYGGSVAVGFYLRGVQEPTFEKCRFKGFSRAAVESDTAVRGLTMDRIHHLGANNAILYAKNTIDITCRGWTSDPFGDYVHASGYVRGGITLIDRCLGVTVTDCQFGRYGVGIFTNGTHKAQFSSLRFMDCDGRQAMNRRIDGPNGLQFGVAIDMGADLIPNSQFGRDIMFSDITIENCIGGNDNFAFYLHDHHNVSVTNLHIISNGVASTSGARAYGMRISDCLRGTKLKNLHFYGLGRFLQFDNDGTLSNYAIDGMTVNGTAYDSQPSGDWGFKWAADAAGTHALRLRDVKIGNTPYIFWLPANGSSGNLVKIEMHEYMHDGYLCQAEYVETCTVKTGQHPRALGELVEIDQTVTDRKEIKAATAGTAARALAICMSAAETDVPYALIASPNTRGMVLCSSAVVNIGDILIHDTANVGKAKADNTATSGRIGRAKTYKAAGSSGLVEIEPIVM